MGKLISQKYFYIRRNLSLFLYFQIGKKIKILFSDSKRSGKTEENDKKYIESKYKGRMGNASLTGEH